MSIALNKHSILGASDSPIKEVEVPEWGGHVSLRVLNVAEGITFQAEKEGVPLESVILLFLTYSLCDEAGKPLFTQAEVSDLASRNPHVIVRLGNEALRHNKMLDSDDEVREGE